MIENLRADLQKLADPRKAQVLQGFFKTGKGEYGEGDVFLGITVPESKELAKKYKGLSFYEIKELLKSKIHEERLIALLILVHNFSKGDEKIKREIYEFYLKSTKYINNWDLVDLSAPKIVGEYLIDKTMHVHKNVNEVLVNLAKSKSIWERRIAIISTFQFIRFQKDYKWTFKIARILLNDKHDLIHKAVGWMLREVGKHVSKEAEEQFLKKHYRKMPRTMLRYAIEHFDPKLRVFYL